MVDVPMSVGTISLIVAATWIALVVVVIAICCAAAHAETVSERLLAQTRWRRLRTSL
jgi:hypothetical protein